MINTISYKDISIRYKDEGEGEVVVLLHGYLESLVIWNEISADLSNEFRVISIDLLGHGDTGCLGEIHTMEMMADAVNSVLEDLKIGTCFMFGHSMGGYVALAFSEKYPDKLKGFSLVHSTPFADTEEKRQNRQREIELIEKGKKELLVNTNIPKLYGNKGLIDEIELSKNIANAISDDGAVAVLNGMMARGDMTLALKQSQVPVLIIAGKNDVLIDYKKLEKLSEQVVLSKFVLLNYSGHMGFVEEKGVYVRNVKNWMSRLKECNGNEKE